MELFNEEDDELSHESLLENTAIYKFCPLAVVKAVTVAGILFALLAGCLGVSSYLLVEWVKMRPDSMAVGNESNRIYDYDRVVGPRLICMQGERLKGGSID
ncbi:unnamed protein product [Protopolystoma xenopodis]|uniref:Uncharacterized protein n=1 Tax=Protopolystoma xenopodis TaxID=117903 RepID=A0A448XBW3_9PLAT|nr:unnamed protein product [Protopolystoma xenopodis]